MSNNRFANIWKILKGSPKDFSLQGRIFHSLCVFGMAGLLISVPINLFMGQYEATYILFASITLLLAFYLLSRLARRLSLATWMFGISCNLFFVLIFLFAGGIDGPNLLSFLIALFLMIIISPSNRAKIGWSIVNVGLLAALLYAQYTYPDLVSFEYVRRADRFVDHLLQYMILSAVLYYGTSYLIENYEYERVSAANRAESIRRQNLEINAQKEELERLNSEKDKLFSIIAHDLRTPLSGIYNYMNILFKSNLDPDKRYLIEEELLRQMGGTSDMLANLLLWAQQQLQGVNITLKSVSLNTCICNALEMEISAAQRKSVALELPANDVIVMTDEAVVQIVVRNLVNNALKFTPSGGKVAVTLQESDGHVSIAVADTGVGIPVSQQQFIFKLKAHTTVGTANEKGIGLGLLLCKELAETLGGTLTFDSREGVGTTFVLRLPIEKSLDSRSLSVTL
ncbi:sensor histidine kinase [Parapedobacter koreensis]|uniref:histidine kinase n=1 Tax=Parapedobacter koreensis TaxID=332977 RepID=A0A1H7SCS0_9SPHI|nr:HAMP domain-containing sensor histidine kinase [Parapedobacter koreensis]SEL69534.1 Signal transduction histidine kinase [Parapedobacter koreensis]